MIVLIILASVFGGDKSDNNSSTSSSSGQPAVKDESKQSGDKTLNVGETYKGKKGLEVTVNSFTAANSVFDEQLSCAAVTYKNSGDKQVDFQGYWDWKAQNPAGVIANPTFSGENELNSGSLAPGGTVSGNVCFDGAAPGNYQLNFAPGLSFSSEKASWKATL